MCRDERLVGGHHWDAASEKPADDAARGLDRAERFDHDVVVAAEKGGRVRRHARRLDTAARLVDVTHERTDDAESEPRVLEPRGLGRKARDGLPHLAEPERCPTLMVRTPGGRGRKIIRFELKERGHPDLSPEAAGVFAGQHYINVCPFVDCVKRTRTKCLPNLDTRDRSAGIDSTSQ